MSHPLPLGSVVWNNVLSILNVAAGCISCAGLITIWYKVYIENKFIRSKWILVYSIGAIVMFAISSFAISVFYGQLIKNWHQLYIIVDIWEFSQAFGNAFTYSLFIKRMKMTFGEGIEKTKYQYSKYIYVILYILIVMFVTINMIHILVNYTFFSDINKSINIISSVTVSENQYNIARLLTVWLSAAMDLILCTCFLSLLFKKLWELTFDFQFIGMSEPEKLEMAVSLTDHRESIKIDNNDVELNETQMKIINGISKISVLSTCSVLSAQILLVWLGIMFQIQNASSFNYWMIYVPFRALTNMICIILSFEFMNKWYSKLCGICDDCCFIQCEYITKRKLKKSIKQELKLTLLSHYNKL